MNPAAFFRRFLAACMSSNDTLGLIWQVKLINNETGEQSKTNHTQRNFIRNLRPEFENRLKKNMVSIQMLKHYAKHAHPNFPLKMHI